MNDRMHTVVGVLPPIPQFPERERRLHAAVGLPVPIESTDDREPQRADADRDRPAAAGRNARARRRTTSNVVGRALDRRVPGVRTTRRAAVPATVALSVHDELTREARPTLLVLLATTGFVLLLVAANVANLALARVMGRERELAVRTALGAGRGRIARQLLTESTMLAVAGGALGLAAAGSSATCSSPSPSRFTPRAEEISIDGTVLAFTLGVSVFTGLLFGLLPAFSAIGRAGSRDAGHGDGRQRAHGRAQRADRGAGGHLVRAAGRRRAAGPQLHQAAAGRRRVPHRPRDDDGRVARLREVQHRRRAPRVLQVGAREGRSRTRACRRRRSASRCRSISSSRCSPGCTSRVNRSATAARVRRSTSNSRRPPTSRPSA